MRFGILLAAILAFSLASCGRLQSSSASGEPSAVAAPPVVPAVRVMRGSIASRTTLTAEFQPFQEVDVMAKVAGYVRSIKVDLGDRVREGQVLAELEVPEMTDDVSKASAVVEQMGSEIAAARDELQRAEAAHQIAHLSYSRLQDVAKRETGLIPQQEIDEAHSRDLVSEAQVAAAKSKSRVEESRTLVARAEVTRLKTLRNYVTITAPFAGLVTRRYANLGSMIQAGTASQSQAMPLIRLSQVSTLRLSLPVPESLATSVKVGQPVEVSVKALGRTFEGKVARFAAKVDLATRTMITEVDVANPTSAILPGLYAEVALQTQRHDDVLLVPLEAVERAGSGGRVYAVDASGTVRIVQVQLGFEDSHHVEIVSGLNPSDVVITARRAGLNAGDKVSPKIVDSDR